MDVPVLIAPQTPDELRDMVMERYAIASSNHISNVSKWNNLIEMYRLGTRRNLESKTDERGRMDQANQQIANVSASVMSEAANTTFNFLLRLWNPEMWFSAAPRKGTTLKSAKYVESKTRRQLDESNFYDVIITAMKQVALIGVSIVKGRWSIELGTIYERKLRKGGKTEEFSPNMGVIYDGPMFELVPYNNFYIDPSAALLDDMDYVIEESVMSRERLIEMAEMGFYDGDKVRKVVKELQEGSLGYDPKFDSERATTQTNDYDPHRKNARLITYYEDHRFVPVITNWGNASRNYATVMSKKNENPYDHQKKPFTDFRITVDPVDFWAPGMLEIVRDDQAIMTTLLNMSLDAGTMSLRPQRLYPKSFGIDPRDMQNYVPGRAIAYDDDDPLLMGRRLTDMIYEMKPEAGGYITLLPNLLAIARDEAQRKSRVTDFLTGRAGIGATKTARGIAMLTGNAQEAFSADHIIMKRAATRLLEMLHICNKQFGKPEEDQYGDYDFKVFDDALSDRQVRLTVLQSQQAVLAALGVDMKEVERRILSLAGEPAIEALLPEDGTLDQAQEQQVRGQIMQMGLQNAMGNVGKSQA